VGQMQEYAVTWRQRLALVTASMAMLLISFNTTATNIAFPSIEDEFSSHSLSMVSWVVTAYNITQTTMMLVGGRLADRLGRRRVFLWGMSVMAIGSLASGVAPNVSTLIAARICQAVGAAFVLPTSLAAVLPDYPKARHARVVALWAGIGVFGSTAGPSFAAGLLWLSGWRAVFLTVAPIAALTAVVGRRVLSESVPDRAPDRLDVVGAITGTSALALLALGIVQGPGWGWAAPQTLLTLAVGLVMVPVFAVRCRRHPEPLLNLSLFDIRTFRVATVASGLLATSTSASWLLYPIFMDRIWGYETWQIGLAITPGPAFLVLLNPLTGRYADRHGYRNLMIVGSVSVTIGTLYLSMMLRPENEYLVGFLPATLLIGGGMAFVLGPLNSAALREVPSAGLGEANAGFNTLRFLGAALGVAMAVAVLGSLDRPDLADSFQRSLLLLTITTALAPLLLWLAYPRDAGSRADPRSPAIWDVLPSTPTH
ncbi:MAG: DHA2 family efflux MFS transporter permease subunit, partial [Actinomycetota bacterium]|nr:DHA2 family efflux MFS transporter permease subunit [Actinomycetota bacterium]